MALLGCLMTAQEVGKMLVNNGKRGKPSSGEDMADSLLVPDLDDIKSRQLAPCEEEGHQAVSIAAGGQRMEGDTRQSAGAQSVTTDTACLGQAQSMNASAVQKTTVSQEKTDSDCACRAHQVAFDTSDALESQAAMPDAIQKSIGVQTWAKTNSARSQKTLASGQNKKLRLFSRADMITGAVLLACSGVAGLGAYLMRAQDRPGATVDQRAGKDGSLGPYVVIQNHEGMIYTDLISKSTEFDVVSNLGQNHIVIENSTVCVAFSNCHNQVCVNTGKIKHPGSSIACLPHKLLIEVVNDPANASKMV